MNSVRISKVKYVVWSPDMSHVALLGRLCKLLILTHYMCHTQYLIAGCLCVDLYLRMHISAKIKSVVNNCLLEITHVSFHVHMMCAKPKFFL